MTATLALALILCAENATGASSSRLEDLAHLRMIDLDSRVHTLGCDDKAAAIFVFLAPDCPISRDAVSELNAIAKSSPEIAVFGVISNPAVSRPMASAFASELNASFPILLDTCGDIARSLSPTHVPQAFVVNAQHQIAYRGRMNDLYETPEKKRTSPTTHDLQSALKAIVQGQDPAVAQTEPVGRPVPPVVPVSSPNYARHIAPLLIANCAECHRPGQVAPFSLLSYDDAAKRSQFLGEVVRSRLMPPWKAEKDHGHFVGERRLTAEQIALLTAWSTKGAPRGDESELPPPAKFAEGWRLGEPDLVVEVPVPFTVPASGPDIFQHFVLPVTVPEDKTIVGFEFRPGNPAVVHHAVIFLDTQGGARAKDEETPEPGYRTSGSVEGSVSAMVGVWTPGMTPRRFPKGIGVRMAKTVDVVVQLHLHPSGKEEVDQSKIALHFANDATQMVKTQDMLLMGNILIDIPPGSSRHRITSSITLPIDVTLLSVFPHLHLIGKEMKVTASVPGQEPVPLIWIKDWNFYWQDSYSYRQPVRLPKGTKIELEAYYDNSADNPFNPSTPPQRVLFGNGSTDEMCFAFFQIVTEQRGSMARLAPALIQSFAAAWKDAKIDDAARDKIIDEAGKLFGRRAGEMLKRMLSTAAATSEAGGG